MTNPQQNEIQNEIKQFEKDINLLPDKLKKLNKEQKRIAETKNRQKKIARMKKIHNEKKQIERKINLLHDRVKQFKKRQSLLEKGLHQIAKMQNLSQNEQDQITKMHNQSRDELERITEMRRISNYETMSKEELIIALLKSKWGIAEFLTINLVMTK